MKFYIGVTDNDWFDFLLKRSPDEVNFWQPGGGAFKVLKPGDLFLFKLHGSPHYIVGGGCFVRHSLIPTSLAWEAFAEKNGVDSLESLLFKIRKYQRTREPDPVIGCVILTDPFFLQREDWISAGDWWIPTQRGRSSDRIAEPIRGKLLEMVQERIRRNSSRIPVAAEDAELYGSEYLTRTRPGQGTFRINVTEAYNRRCAITGERTLPVLEAAHIKPVSRTGSNRTSNGLLVRSDMHKLFDLGYLTITPDFHVEVSKRIKEEYENGREYYAFHGKELRVLPANPTERPSLELIEWHNQNIYVP